MTDNFEEQIIPLQSGGFTGGAIDIETIKDLSDRAGSQIAAISLDYADHGIPSSVPVLIDRTSGNAVSLKKFFDEWRNAPDQKRGTARVTTLESLIELTNRHMTENSAIFANTDWQKPSLTSVIDYHERVMDGLADNGKHRVHYEFPLSDAWKAWVAIDGKAMEQTAFAEFIEDRIADLASPDTMEEEDFRHKFSFRIAHPNELVTLSRGLQINSESKVKNIVSLQSGAAQLTFEEEHRDSNGNKIDVPGMFILAVPPFFRGEPVRVPVRLRYRVASGKVLWTCKLYKPDVYITEQIIRDMELASSETGLPAYQGAPEMTAS